MYEDFGIGTMSFVIPIVLSRSFASQVTRAESLFPIAPRMLLNERPGCICQMECQMDVSHNAAKPSQGGM